MILYLDNFQSLSLDDSVGELYLSCHLSLWGFRENLSSKTFKKETKIQVLAPVIALSLCGALLPLSWKLSTLHCDSEV